MDKVQFKVLVEQVKSIDDLKQLQKLESVIEDKVIEIATEDDDEDDDDDEVEVETI